MKRLKRGMVLFLLAGTLAGATISYADDGHSVPPPGGPGMMPGGPGMMPGGPGMGPGGPGGPGMRPGGLDMGPGRPGEPGMRLGGPGTGPAGEVTDVMADVLTLHTLKGKTVTVSLSKDTQVQAWDSANAGTLDDLKVGEQVRIDARLDAEWALEAHRIRIVPAGELVTGQVAMVTGSALTVRNRRADGSVTVTDTTKIMVKSAPGSVSDLKVGQFVEAYGTTQDASLAAAVVIVRDAPAGPQGWDDANRFGPPPPPMGQSGPDGRWDRAGGPPPQNPGGPPPQGPGGPTPEEPSK